MQLVDVVPSNLSSMDDTARVDPRTCSPDGWVRIIGFGSLLAKSSAERSFPGLRGWTIVRLPSCCRVFGHAAPLFYDRGIAQGFEVASLSCEPVERQAAQVVPSDEPVVGSSEDFEHTVEEAMEAINRINYMCATAFYIPFKSMKEFREREPEFTYVTVQPYSLTSFAKDGRPAIMCGRGSDALLRERLGGTTECAARRWKEMVTDYGLDTVWELDRDTLLPCGPYLRLCVLAAEVLGIRDNFL